MPRGRLLSVLASATVLASAGGYALAEVRAEVSRLVVATTWSAALRDPGPPPSPAPGGPGVTLYVSCAGDDRNGGTAAAPLRSVTAATRRALPAGSSILFARGCSWTGPVEPRGSGTAESPVVVGAYGTGPDPVLTGSPAAGSPAAVRLLGDYQTVRDVHVTDAAGSGVEIWGEHATVRDVEIDGAGIGVLLGGPYGSVFDTRVHDLHMVVDTPGGDDDYGAVGFDVQAAGVEIARSSCVNCRATSHDYGHDGGFAEIWNDGDDLDLHDDTGENTDGILEMGGNRPAASARRVEVRDNRFQDAHGGIVIHEGDRFGITVTALTVSGNTIVNTSADDTPVLSGPVREVSFLSNTVSTPAVVSASGAPASHRCNTYDAVPDKIGFALDPSEGLSGSNSHAGC